MSRLSSTFDRFFGKFRSKRSDRKRKGLTRLNRRSFNIEPLEERTLLSVCTWDGGGADDNWMTAANWVGDAAPQAGDELVFAGTVRTDTNNDYTADTEFASLTIEDDDFTLGGNRIELTGDAYDLGISVDTGVTGAEIELDIVLDDSIDMDADGALTISGDISGSYGMESIGDETLTLTGANTYTGNTTITTGTLQIGDGVTDGSIVSDIIDNSELIFNNTSYFLYEGDISGTGDLGKNGDGTLQLTGDLTYYSGDKAVDGGELLIGDIESVFVDADDIVFNDLCWDRFRYAYPASTHYTLYGSVSPEPEDGTLTCSNTGIIYWTPDEECDSGSYTVQATYEYDDGYDYCYQVKVFSITVEELDTNPWIGHDHVVEKIYVNSSYYCEYYFWPSGREDSSQVFSFESLATAEPPGASINNDGVFTCTFNASDVGTIYDFYVKVTDSSGQYDRRRVTFLVYDDTYTEQYVLECPSYYWSVSENDINAPYTGSTDDFTFYLSPEHENVHVELVIDEYPSHGTLKLTEEGLFYTPVPNYRGLDSYKCHYEVYGEDTGTCYTEMANVTTRYIQVGSCVDMASDCVYDLDSPSYLYGYNGLVIYRNDEKIEIEVGDSSTVNLTLQSPWDDNPASGYLILTYSASNLTIYDENGSEMFPYLYYYVESFSGEKNITLTVHGLSATDQACNLIAVWYSGAPTDYYPNTVFYRSWNSRISYLVVDDAGQQLPDIDECECECSCACAATEEPGDLATGSSTTEPTGSAVSGLSLVTYNSQENSQPSISLDYTFADTEATLDYVVAYVEFNSVDGDDVYYDASGYTSDDTVHISLLADASALLSGHYDYTVYIEEHYTDAATLEYTYSNSYDYVSRTDSEFGMYWWQDDLDQIIVEDDGVLFIEGDGTTGWMPVYNTSSYIAYNGCSFTKSGSTYTLTYRDGSVSTFTALGNDVGVLTQRIDSEGNTTTYTYTDADSDGYADEILTITDPTGEVTKFVYSGSLVSQIQYDYDSTSQTYQREVNLEYTSGLLTTITIGETGESNPEWNYEYVTSGDNTGLLTSVKNPNHSVTTNAEIIYAYDFAGRLASATYPNNASQTLTSLAVAGLVDLTATGYDVSHKASFTDADDVAATRTDQYGNVSYYTTDEYGLLTYEQNTLGEETEYERDYAGRITKITEPDPDGDGPLVSNVTEYVYDGSGNLLQATYAVGTDEESSEKWYYDSNNFVKYHIDELGNITKYDVNDSGMVLSVIQMVGLDDDVSSETDDITLNSYIYTNGSTDSNGGAYDDSDYQYLPVGLLISETDALGVVTEYEYGTDDAEGSFGLVTAITYAVGTGDEASVQYEYDARGNMVASIDELGNRTEYLYNNLDQLIETRAVGAIATVDNGEADFATAGSWTTVPGSGGIDDDYAYAASGDGSYTATWTFEDLDPDKQYEVIISWVADDTYGAEDSPFSVYDGDTSTGDLLDTFDTVQTVSPGGHSVYGSEWESLGRFTISGDTLTVLLTNDANGRVIADAVKIVEIASSTTYQYDGLGNRTHVTDPSGATTVTAYCPLGVRTTSVTQNYVDGVYDPDYPDEDVTTTYTYDAGLRLTAVTDQLGNVTSYTYDALGRKISEGHYSATDLAGYWKLDGEDSGTTPDATDNENDGVMISDAVISGGVLVLDGTGDAVRVPEDDAFDIYGTDAEITISAWVYADDVDATQYIVAKINGWTSNTAQYALYADTYGRLRFISGVTDDYYALSTPAISPGQWHHVVVVYEDCDTYGQVTFYVDGVDVTDPNDATCEPIVHATADLYIGARGNNDSEQHTNTVAYCWDGMIDEVQILDRAFSAEDVAQLRGSTYSYDDAGNLIRQTDAAGNPTEYRYDSLGRLAETLLPETAGQTALGSVNYGVFATDAATGTGYIMYSEQDVQDRFSMTTSVSNHLITVIYTGGQWYYDNNSAYVQFTPVASDVLLAEVDFDNDSGAMLEGIDAAENGIVKGYFAGDLDLFADRLNGSYDDGDFTVTGTWFITYADAVSTAYEYDAAGQLVATTDTLGVETRYEYDDLGRQVKVTQNYIDGVYDSQYTDEDIITTYAYDAAGQLIATTDTLGVETRYEYDSLGRQVKAVQNYVDGDYDDDYPDEDVTTEYEYDAAGNLVSVFAVVAESTTVETRYEYDDLGRQVKVTQNYVNGVYDSQYPDEDVITSYEYDIAGQLISTTDPLGNITAYTYDALGRVVAEVQYDSNDLIGYWTLDDDSATTHVTDSSDAGNDGTLAGGGDTEDLSADGVFNSAFDFDGSHYVNLGEMPIGTGDRTLTAWINTTTTDTVGIVGCADTSSADGRQSIHMLSTGIVRGMLDTGSPIMLSSDYALNDGQWHFLALTMDRDGDLVLYVDGEEHDRAAINYTSALPSLDFWIGAYGDASHNPDYLFDGLIDDVRIYDRALSADDVAAVVSQKKYAYDAVGQLVATTDPLGIETRYEYDNLGRMTKSVANYVDGVYNSSYTDEDIITTYAYDAAGRLVSTTDAAGATAYYEYDAMGRQTKAVQPAADATLSIGTVNYGIHAIDAATGTGYILYSAEVVQTRFKDFSDGSNINLASDHLIAVKYVNGQWYYDDNYVYRSFTPEPTDVLIAEVDFTNDTITSLEGTDTTVGGILAGYDDGDLTYTADWWNGAADDGEFTVEGTWFTRSYPATTYYEYDAAGRLVRQTDPLGATAAYAYDALGRAIAQQQYPSEGLVGRFTLDEGSGTTAADSSGAGAVGTLVPEEGEPAWTDGRFDSALEFDGTNQVQLDGLAVNTATGAKTTVSLWMKWDGSGNKMLFGWYRYDLYLCNESGNDYLGFNTGSNDLIGIDFPVEQWADKWVHVTAVFVNGTPTTENVELYINGEKQVLSSKRAGSPTNRSVAETGYISGYGYNTNYRFTGIIDDVLIYRRALSADEVAAIAGSTYTYDAAGQLVRQTDAIGNPTEYRYDSLGRMTETLSPDTNGQTEIGDINYGVAAYDSATGTGYVMYSETDVFARFDPDPYANNSDHLVTVIYSGGQWLYDNNAGTYTPFTPAATDVLIAELDFDADTIVSLEGIDSEYEGIALGYMAGDLRFIADWLNGAADDGDFTVYGTYFIPYADAAATVYAYDAAGRLLSLTDPEENTTEYEYDALGRVTSETNELDAERVLVYNAAGQLVRRIDREDRVTVYQYDSLGRNTAEIWYADATDADADQDRLATIAYVYDAAGRMLTAEDAESAEYEYVYDSLGRLAEETQTVSGMDTIVFAYAYDAVGNLTQVATTIGSTADAVTDYEYDALGRVTKIEQHGAIGGNAVAEKRIDLAYDAQSRYATISYYNDLDGLSGNLVMTATYAYDPSGRLTDLVYTDSTTATIREFDWAYNAVGWITSHDSDIASEGVTSYAYDATGQLIGADYASVGDESYVYDSNGNRVLVDGTESYTTGDNNQTTSDGTYSYIYDAEGNLRFRLIDGGDPTTDAPNAGDTDITEFTWDHRNRLVEVADYSTFSLYDAETPDSVVDYIYDAFNRRITSLYDNDGDADVDVEERYSWQGKSVALDFVDSDGDGETYSLELAHRYLWGQAVDQLFAQENVDDGGVEDVLYPVRDNLGSTRSLINYLGQITATYSYDTFGNASVLVGSISDTRYLFTCQEYDLTTGLYYYDARWYDPTVGKFISVDPISFSAGDANLYRYVGNAPSSFSDPFGLEAAHSSNGKDPISLEQEGELRDLVDKRSYYVLIDGRKQLVEIDVTFPDKIDGGRTEGNFIAPLGEPQIVMDTYCDPKTHRYHITLNTLDFRAGWKPRINIAYMNNDGYLSYNDMRWSVSHELMHLDGFKSILKQVARGVQNLDGNFQRKFKDPLSKSECKKQHESAKALAKSLEGKLKTWAKNRIELEYVEQWLHIDYIVQKTPGAEDYRKWIANLRVVEVPTVRNSKYFYLGDTANETIKMFNDREWQMARELSGIFSDALNSVK